MGRAQHGGYYASASNDVALKIVHEMTSTVDRTHGLKKLVRPTKCRLVRTPLVDLTARDVANADDSRH